MKEPEIQIVAVSNVFTRLMRFVNKGDVENGHVHHYDHATMVSSGSILYEVLDGENGNPVVAKEFKAPGFVFVEKNKFHRITSLEDNTVCVCIHALRTIDENIIPPDTFITPLVSKGAGEDVRAAVTHLNKCEFKDIVVPKSFYDLSFVGWNEPKETIGGHHGT